MLGEVVFSSNNPTAAGGFEPEETVPPDRLVRSFILSQQTTTHYISTALTGPIGQGNV